MPQPVDVRDDGAHEHGGDAGWSERLSFNFFDAGSGFGGVARLEFRPADAAAEATINLFVPGNAVATVLAKETVEGTATSSAGRIRFDRIEALEKWRLRCKDVALVFPGAGVQGLPPRGERSGGAAQIDLDLSFEAWMPPLGSVERTRVNDELGFVQVVSSGHFEQAGRYTGRIRLGQRAATVQGTGVRDRTWGARNETATHAATWLTAAFSPALAFGIRTVTVGEREMHSGWAWVDGDLRGIVKVHVEAEYEGRWCRAMTARVLDSSGEPHEISCETLVTLPLNEGRRRVHHAMVRAGSGGRETLGLAEFVGR